jgi:hypothetical protein
VAAVPVVPGAAAAATATATAVRHSLRSGAYRALLLHSVSGATTAALLLYAAAAPACVLPIGRPGAARAAAPAMCCAMALAACIVLRAARAVGTPVLHVLLLQLLRRLLLCLAELLHLLLPAFLRAAGQAQLPL